MYGPKKQNNVWGSVFYFSLFFYNAMAPSIKVQLEWVKLQPGIETESRTLPEFPFSIVITDSEEILKRIWN